MPRFLTLIAALLSPAVSSAQLPTIAPVEKALERVSLGPQVGAAGAVSLRGAGLLVTLGGGVTVFDRYVVTDPACEARRREERRRLGGEKLKPWGEVLDSLQQQCRPLEEHWWPQYDFGAELGLTLLPSRVGQVRAWFAPLSWRRFTLGLSAAVPFGEAPSGGTAIGLRLGPEFAAHLRWSHDEWRPSAAVFLRIEPSLLHRELYSDQLLVGARYLFDL